MTTNNDAISFIPEFADYGGTIKVLLNNHQIGFADIHIHNKHIKINRLSIDNEYRGEGRGKALMNYIIDLCNKKRWFSVTVRPCSAITPESKAMGKKGLTQKELIRFYENFCFVKNDDLMCRKFRRLCLFKPKNVFFPN